MKVLYGQRGQPVASVDGDEVYDKTGVLICRLYEKHLYLADSGERVGCFVDGVVYNAFGAPQAFADGCKKTKLLPMAPRLTPMAPRLSGRGMDLSELPSKSVPPFLRDADRSELKILRDGLFQ